MHTELFSVFVVCADILFIFVDLFQSVLSRFNAVPCTREKRFILGRQFLHGGDSWSERIEYLFRAGPDQVGLNDSKIVFLLVCDCSQIAHIAGKKLDSLVFERFNQPIDRLFKRF